MSNRRTFLTLLLALVALLTGSAQNHYQRLATLDVQHYVFSLKLNATDANIQGSALVTIKFLKETPDFQLDLVKKNNASKGMTVSAVSESGQNLTFQHEGESLTIRLAKTARAGEERTFQIDYQGVPADGLIIDNNKFGDRTIFGDNWPNRAHHWLPTVDHPSDKASVEFIVTAPNDLQVIANGIQIEETNLDNGLKITHWRETGVLPTKVMVIGAAPFAVQLAGETHGIPVTSWVFPENRKAGFYDYEPAVNVLDWFIKNVAPYPYQKLANVQSKTRYGGMENASNIFYFENSVTGGREREGLIAHEIAHQWFGNTASEANWHHVWLSEGFATYFTILYMESTYGVDAAKQELIADRQQVIQFNNRNPRPIVDTTITDYNQVLNTNSYQKGSWVLHMLRQEVGDSAFWKGVRTYYDRYKFSNALTADLQKVMEEVSGKKLSAFFKQWLFQAGQPKLQVNWNYNNAAKDITLEISQIQAGASFQFPLDVAIYYDGSEKPVIQNFIINEKTNRFTLKADKAPSKIILDPNIKLLFAGEIIKK
ncbi:MAG: M1 family metallopeptidase [Saprospiraceae bacterium]